MTKTSQTLEGMTFFHPLQTYTRKDLEAFFHTGRDTVDTWIRTGLIHGIQSGATLVFTFDEIRRFQEAMTGRSIQNTLECLKVSQEINDGQ